MILKWSLKHIDAIMVCLVWGVIWFIVIVLAFGL